VIYLLLIFSIVYHIKKNKIKRTGSGRIRARQSISAKLDEKGCLGSPDLIIEIVSPATVQKDMREKLSIYEKFGVKEYWIIHPVDQILMVFKLLPGNKYGRPDIFSSQDQVKVGILPDLTINLATVFKD